MLDKAELVQVQVTELKKCGKALQFVKLQQQLSLMKTSQPQ